MCMSALSSCIYVHYIVINSTGRPYSLSFRALANDGAKYTYVN